MYFQITTSALDLSGSADEKSTSDTKSIAFCSVSADYSISAERVVSSPENITLLAKESAHCFIRNKIFHFIYMIAIYFGKYNSFGYKNNYDSSAHKPVAIDFKRHLQPAPFKAAPTLFCSKPV